MRMLNFQSRVKQTSHETPTLRSRLAATAPRAPRDTPAEEVNLNEQFLSILNEDPSLRLNAASNNESITDLAGRKSAHKLSEPNLLVLQLALQQQAVHFAARQSLQSAVYTTPSVRKFMNSLKCFPKL